VPLGRELFQATQRAGSLPRFDVARHGRRCLGAAPGRVVLPVLYNLRPSPSRVMSPERVTPWRVFPPCCEGQRTGVLAGVVPTCNPAKRLELWSFWGAYRVGPFALLRGKLRDLAGLARCEAPYARAKRGLRL
jgi:hypothetical protein